MSKLPSLRMISNVERFETSYDEQGQKRLIPSPGPVDLKAGGFRMPLASLSTPSVQPAPMSGAEKPGQVRESAPGSTRKA